MPLLTWPPNVGVLYMLLKWWQRRLIAWLRLYFPWLTRFMRFSPGTYIRWLQAKSRKGQYSFDFI